MKKSNRISDWLICPRPQPAAKNRLFLFPYAGAVPSAFWEWADYLPGTVELVLLQLPGRGARLKEPPVTSFSFLIEKSVQALAGHLDKPFAFFGHSLGGLVAFEVARVLQNIGKPPVHLFISGKGAAHIKSPNPSIHNLADQEFIEALQQLGGLPQHVFDFPEIIEVSLPSLRADIQMLENYEYLSEAVLSCPISVYGADNDPLVIIDHLRAWERHTENRFVCNLFKGGHFFINEDKESFFKIFVAELNQLSLTV